LIFKPVLIDNAHDQDAAIDGAFIYERKSPNGTWGEVNELPLSKLRAQEWIKLDLKAAELLTLVQWLNGYYDYVRENGIPYGFRNLIEAPRSKLLGSLLSDEELLATSLDDADLAASLIAGLVKWIASHEEAVAAARFNGVSIEALQKFDAVLGLARLQRLCDLITENSNNDDESFWQRTLAQNGWAIAQVFSIPILLVHDQVYVGGKRFSNTGGNTADFLFENNITGNVVVVEIKTPAAPLLASVYRNNVYPPSDELTAGLAQTLHARQSIVRNYDQLVTDGMRSSRVLSAKGLLIVGSAKRSLTTPEQSEAFELFRNNQRDIEIVTFDELREKLQLMIKLLESASDDVRP
jgi:hypothetical protein